jgi:hypothetical protein
MDSITEPPPEVKFIGKPSYRRIVGNLPVAKVTHFQAHSAVHVFYQFKNSGRTLNFGL